MHLHPLWRDADRALAGEVQPRAGREVRAVNDESTDALATKAKRLVLSHEAFIASLDG